LDFLTLEDETDRLSRNVGKELPLYAAFTQEQYRSHIHGGGSLKAPIFSLDFTVEPKALLINALQAY
jgi:hypothetical protein